MASSSVMRPFTCCHGWPGATGAWNKQGFSCVSLLRLLLRLNPEKKVRLSLLNSILVEIIVGEIWGNLCTFEKNRFEPAQPNFWKMKFLGIANIATFQKNRVEPAQPDFGKKNFSGCLRQFCHIKFMKHRVQPGLLRPNPKKRGKTEVLPRIKARKGSSWLRVARGGFGAKSPSACRSPGTDSPSLWPTEPRLHVRYINTSSRTRFVAFRVRFLYPWAVSWRKGYCMTISRRSFFAIVLHSKVLSSFVSLFWITRASITGLSGWRTLG